MARKEHNGKKINRKVQRSYLDRRKDGIAKSFYRQRSKKGITDEIVTDEIVKKYDEG